MSLIHKIKYSSRNTALHDPQDLDILVDYPLKSTRPCGTLSQSNITSINMALSY
jgi:hypothetical protein